MPQKLAPSEPFGKREVRPARFSFSAESWHHANMQLRIRKLRNDKGWTGEHLGDLVGVTKGYVSELENGKKTPGAALLIRLADALGVSVADLFEGSAVDRTRAEIEAHAAVMMELAEEDRRSIVRAAEGLLRAQGRSSGKLPSDDPATTH